jgi:hypothetical protein
MTTIELIRNLTRRINGRRQQPLQDGQPYLHNRLYEPYITLQITPPPPPIPQQPKETPPPKMLPEGFVDIINKNEDNLVRNTPTPTSTTYEEYNNTWCGTTENFMYSGSTSFNHFLVKNKAYDERPLKHFLMKKFKWIEDVTEVRKSNNRPLEVHITVSPIHHSELMIPSVEKFVREKLYEGLSPLITCMYEDVGNDKPLVIFSPSHSETILEHFK